jgi:hypothetical protein
MSNDSAAPSGIGLYYPFIHVRSEQWLKMALLYWDKIRRIVPDEYELEDGMYGSKPAVDDGSVERVSPTKYLQLAAERFRTTVIPSLQRDQQRDDLPLTKAFEHINEWGASYEMHPGKVDTTLQRELLAQQLAVAEQGDTHYRMPRAIGIAYMLCLAQTISTAVHAEPVTHDPLAAKLSSALSFQPDDTTDRIPALVALDLPFPDAEALQQVPWKKLLQFRKRNAALRIDFRSTIAEILAKIPQEADSQAVTDVLERERVRLKSAIEQHKQALDRLVTSTTVSSLQISIPTTIATALTSGSLPTSSVIALGTTVVALLTVGWWAKYQTDRARLVESPYQYLLSAHRLAH